MRYAVNKIEHHGDVYWYVEPVTKKEEWKYPYLFVGEWAEILATEKAKELNEKERTFALAA